MANDQPCDFCGNTQIEHSQQKKLLFYCEGFDVENDVQIIHQEFCWENHQASLTECNGACEAYMKYLKSNYDLGFNHDVILVTNRGIANIGG